MIFVEDADYMSEQTDGGRAWNRLVESCEEMAGESGIRVRPAARCRLYAAGHADRARFHIWLTQSAYQLKPAVIQPILRRPGPEDTSLDDYFRARGYSLRHFSATKPVNAHIGLQGLRQ